MSGGNPASVDMEFHSDPLSIDHWKHRHRGGKSAQLNDGLARNCLLQTTAARGTLCSVARRCTERGPGAISRASAICCMIPGHASWQLSFFCSTTPSPRWTVIARNFIELIYREREILPRERAWIQVSSLLLIARYLYFS